MHKKKKLTTRFPEIQTHIVKLKEEHNRQLIQAQLLVIQNATVVLKILKIIRSLEDPYKSVFCYTCQLETTNKIKWKFQKYKHKVHFLYPKLIWTQLFGVQFYLEVLCNVSFKLISSKISDFRFGVVSRSEEKEETVLFG